MTDDSYFIDFSHLSQQLTDDWVATFSKPINQNGIGWVMAGSGFLPQGVNGSDPRVMKLCQKAKKYYENEQDEKI